MVTAPETEEDGEPRQGLRAMGDGMSRWEMKDEGWEIGDGEQEVGREMGDVTRHDWRLPRETEVTAQGAGVDTMGDGRIGGVRREKRSRDRRWEMGDGARHERWSFSLHRREDGEPRLGVMGNEMEDEYLR